MAKRILTPTFRASFPQLFEAKSMDGNPDKAKFSIQMIFDKKADLKELKLLVEECAKEKWGAKIPKNLMLPFRDGSEKSDEYSHYADTVFANASTKFRPGVVDQNVQEIISQDDFYAGCYARASVSGYAWEYMGKAGVSLNLHNVQKVKDGDRLDSAVSAVNEFEAIADSNSGNFTL